MPIDSPVLPAAVSIYDARPFFEKALQFGIQNCIIDSPKLDAIGADAPKGMVQIARYFGNEFLRPDLEKAKDRLVNLLSLYLESTSGGELRLAAESLRDYSFLSQSKGGSDMLRALLAMPENTNFYADLDTARDERGPPKGLAEWSLKSFSDYQAEFARRQPIQQELGAAVWLAGHLGVEQSELEEGHTHAEAVIRTALLSLAVKRTEFPDWVGFEKMVAALRKKHRSAHAAAAGQAAIAIPKDLPDEFRPVVQTVRQSVIADLGQIVGVTLSARALFVKDSDHRTPPFWGRYFWLEDMASELDHHERSISRAWDKATGGNCDDGSLLTLFVCVAASVAPKTLLSEKAAAALVRRIQKSGGGQGFDPELACRYILDIAPAEHQDDYAGLWADFVEEAQAVLQSDSVSAHKDALALLRRECNVKP